MLWHLPEQLLRCHRAKLIVNLVCGPPELEKNAAVIILWTPTGKRYYSAQEDELADKCEAAALI